MIKLGLLATKEVSASSLFGLYDTLSSAGKAWEVFVTGESPKPLFDVKIISSDNLPFRCASGTQILPDAGLSDIPDLDLIVVPGMNVSAIEPLGTTENADRKWVFEQHAAGTRVVAACTGAVYLAELGILNGVEATTHWAYKELFREYYPKVKLNLERNICFEDTNSGVVTSGGTTAWQELSLFLIQNYSGMEQARRTAKFWLMTDRGDFQTPYSSMIFANSNDDAVVRRAQLWLVENYFAENPVNAVIEQLEMPASTLSRRFKKATGTSPKDYVHAIRIEEAKKRLESTELTVDEIGQQVGYEDSSSFRRLFKRKTSLTPAKYRKMFGTERFLRYT